MQIGFRYSSLVLLFVALPLALFYMGDFYSKGTLMQSLSLVSILGFTLLISQFFTSRLNKAVKLKKALPLHKFIGYTFIAILIFHPIFIVVPKFFDNTVTPYDAFIRMITTFSSNGIIFGIIAYVSMIVLLITSFFRNSLGLKYKTWRILHGVLTLVFVIFALLHALDLGKHINISFEVYYIFIVAIGVVALILGWIKK